MVPPSILTLIRTITAIRNPYIPCVAGKSCNTISLPATSGFSDTTAEAVSPAAPTLLLDPMPEQITAKAAPTSAKI